MIFGFFKLKVNFEKVERRKKIELRVGKTF
jgi:hypothetical protein